MKTTMGRSSGSSSSITDTTGKIIAVNIEPVQKEIRNRTFKDNVDVKVWRERAWEK